MFQTKKSTIFDSELIYTLHIFQMFAYLLVALTALTYGLYYYFKTTYNYWKKKNVAGPEPMFLFGNLFESVMRKKHSGTVFKEAYDQFPNEKVVGVYRMVTPSLLIKDLDIVKQIMIKDFDLFVDRGVEFSKQGLGANLFHADGDTWRVLRNRFTPLFTSGKLKNMSYLMTNAAEDFLNYVDTLTKEQPVQDVYTLVRTFTVTIISACAFGLDIDIHNDKKLLKRVATIDKLIFEPTYFFELDMLYPGVLKKINSSLFPKLISTFFYELARNVILDRKGAPIGRKDFMDLILELRQQGEIKGMRRSDETELQLDFNEDVIAAQAFIFYAAGYETSATTMAFMLYELAKNKDVQEKLLEEIDEVLKKYDGKVTYDCISDLHYMEKVFNETLRLYPIVDTLQRRAMIDYKVPGLDLVIEKGTLCLIPPLAIHRDAKHYPDPEKFDPERFSPENVGNRHPCAHIPFGTGPRNCIGMRFAKVQSRICITRLLSKYRVEPTDRTLKIMQFNPKRVVISPNGGIHLKLVPRA
ncbi:cytochrome P450 6B1-like [Plodia interpunctella]|uniref:cytochrome P450 6B1-like n=1 Tax=Plodia interpunctella TaxID=58824 RepID=UPI0023688930|nr:cytochrome P450 6B1-like [Plodia interpunctella]